MSYTPIPNPINIYPLDFHVQDSGYTDGKTAQLLNIFGYRNQWNSTGNLGDCACYLGGGQDTINTPAVGTTYYLNSTSVQDATGGTGVDRVRIIYLDTNGLQQVVIGSLNGTTAVSLGAGFTFIQWMEAYHSTTENRVAAGAITISSINGVATEATTMEMILAATNRSQSGRYKVPSNKHAYLLDYDVSANGANFSTNIRATRFSDDGTLSNAFHFLSVASIKDGVTYSTDLHYARLPANCVLKISAFPSSVAVNSRMTGSMHLIVEDGVV